MSLVPGRRPDFADVQEAAARLRGRVVRTPMLRHPLLDSLAGGTVLVKPEPPQRTGSFSCVGRRTRRC
jgi:threonine dehydratase